MISPSPWGALHSPFFFFLQQTSPNSLYLSLPPPLFPKLLTHSHISHRGFRSACSFHLLLSRSFTTPIHPRFLVAASKSPYEILGVSNSASDADIKRAYRKLALKWHPDVNKAPGAGRKFMLIKNAYQTLIDPVSRLEYDAAVNGNFDPFNRYSSTSEGESPEDYYDIDDFWRDLQFSFDEIVSSLQEEFGMKERNPNKPKSVWEELTEIGGEFVDFIEKELNTLYDANQPMGEEHKSDNNGSNTNASDKERDTKELEEDINEIEKLLAKLRKELGL